MSLQDWRLHSGEGGGFSLQCWLIQKKGWRRAARRTPPGFTADSSSLQSSIQVSGVWIKTMRIFRGKHVTDGWGEGELGSDKARSEGWEGRCVYSALEVCVSLKSLARLSASSSDMSTDAPSRLRLRRPERLEKLLTGPPRLHGTKQKQLQPLLGTVQHSGRYITRWILGLHNWSK